MILYNLDEPDSPPQNRKRCIILKRCILRKRRSSHAFSRNKSEHILTNLEIVLDQVENKIPMCARNIPQDRYKMEKHVRDLALDVFVNVRIRRDPSLACLHKVHRAGLWQEHYVRIWIRRCGDETT